jgi:DNA-binding XRE family transcriptional regulator
MIQKFRDWVAQMPEERQARIAAKTRQLLDEMPLQALRRALELTRQQVAASLGINRVAVSKMEGQTDMYVSTLRRFVEAMGGEPRIVAHFPQGNVEISQFKREAEPEPAEPAAA